MNKTYFFEGLQPGMRDTCYFVIAPHCSKVNAKSETEK